MRFFIDECLSPSFPARLAELGHEAVHPLHVGRRGQPDHVVKAVCLAEDRVLVTENIGDFRGLLGDEAIHPGMIALPPADKETAWRMLLRAIAFIEALGGDPMGAMVNGIVAFDAAGEPRLESLSKRSAP